MRELDGPGAGETGEPTDPEQGSTDDGSPADDDAPASDDAGGSTGAIDPDTGADTAEDDGASTDTGVGSDDTGLEPDETDGGDTGLPPDQAPDDGDHAANPGVVVQFRNTAGAPVSVEGPLFDLEAPIDTRGLQYIQEVSNPGDVEDFIAFNIVPGENDPVIEVELHCGSPELDPQPLRADVLDEDGAVIDTVICGDGPSMVLLEQASSLDEYQVVVYALEGMEHFDAYTLEIDAFCFQACTFQPYQP